MTHRQRACRRPFNPHIPSTHPPMKMYKPDSCRQLNQRAREVQDCCCLVGTLQFVAWPARSPRPTSRFAPLSAPPALHPPPNEQESTRRTRFHRAACRCVPHTPAPPLVSHHDCGCPTFVIPCTMRKGRLPWPAPALSVLFWVHCVLCCGLGPDGCAEAAKICLVAALLGATWRMPWLTSAFPWPPSPNNPLGGSCVPPAV